MQQLNNLTLITLVVLMIKPLRGTAQPQKLIVSVNQNDGLMHYQICEHKSFLAKLPVFLTKSDGQTVDAIIEIIEQSPTYEISEYHFSPSLSNKSEVEARISGVKSVA